MQNHCWPRLYARRTHVCECGGVVPCYLTSFVVNSLVHGAGLSRRDPQRKAGLLEPQAEELAGPIPNLRSIGTHEQTTQTTDDALVNFGNQSSWLEPE